MIFCLTQQTICCFRIFDYFRCSVDYVHVVSFSMCYFSFINNVNVFIFQSQNKYADVILFSNDYERCNPVTFSIREKRYSSKSCLRESRDVWIVLRDAAGSSWWSRVILHHIGSFLRSSCVFNIHFNVRRVRRYGQPESSSVRPH